MWLNNNLARKLGVGIPLIQAPMAGGATTPELIASVSNNEALGSLAAGYMEPSQIKATIKEIKQLTDKPFAVNLFIPEKYHVNSDQITNMQEIIRHVCPELELEGNICKTPYSQPFDKQIQVVLEEKVPILSFTFGVLAKNYVSELKKNKVLLIGTATNLEEAQVLENDGIDIIVAQGAEAGGHRGTFIKTQNNLIELKEFIPKLVNNIKTPIVAAGGIMNASHIVEVLKLGASGVQMGTAFLTCAESGIHPSYKERILKAESDNTVLTKSFSGKLARGIENQFITRMHNYEDQILDYPVQNALTQNMRRVAGLIGNTEFLSMWAGQNLALCKSTSVAMLINELNDNIKNIE